MKNLKEILLVITRPIKAFSKIEKKLLIAPFIFLIVGAALMQTSQEIVKRQKSLKSLKAELKKVQSGESQLELPENVPRLDQEKMIKEEIKAQKNFLLRFHHTLYLKLYLTPQAVNSAKILFGENIIFVNSRGDN